MLSMGMLSAIYGNVKWSFLLNTTYKPLMADQLDTVSYIKGSFRFKKKNNKERKKEEILGTKYNSCYQYTVTYPLVRGLNNVYL